MPKSETLPKYVAPICRIMSLRAVKECYPYSVFPRAFRFVSPLAIIRVDLRDTCNQNL